MRDAMDRIADDIYLSENWKEVQSRGVEYFCLPGSHDWVAYDVPTASQMLPDLRTYIQPNAGHGRAGHLDSPDEAQAKSAFFAQIFAGGDEGLEVEGVEQQCFEQLRVQHAAFDLEDGFSMYRFELPGVILGCEYWAFKRALHISMARNDPVAEAFVIIHWVLFKHFM